MRNRGLDEVGAAMGADPEFVKDLDQKVTIPDDIHDRIVALVGPINEKIVEFTKALLAETADSAITEAMYGTICTQVIVFLALEQGKRLAQAKFNTATPTLEQLHTGMSKVMSTIPQVASFLFAHENADLIKDTLAAMRATDGADMSKVN